MKIYVVGSTKNTFFKLDDIREKFLIDEKHAGDHLDFLNPWYCEFTGIYYLWKNCTDDIVGLEHYRRSFDLHEDRIRDILNSHDIILHKTVGGLAAMTLYQRIKRGFNYGSMQDLLTKFLLCLKYVHPECWPCIVSTLDLHWHYQYNMFIAKREILDSFMNWIMPAIYLFEKEFSAKNFNKRGMGYIIEILAFTVWVLYSNLKVFNSNVHEYRFDKIGYK